MGNLLAGLKVVGSEIKWLALGGLRAFEIRRMEKRLDQEYQALGKQVHEQAKTQGPDQEPVWDEKTQLALKQIDFLREEIAYLKEERKRFRSEFVSSRANGLGFKEPNDKG
ncbi:MAG: hypothetical protein SVS15_07230 [Thermodesulfobacteriota bacterium]|nr:hypothetical protein [Thermodesulfobacteriota bacterium]